MENFTKTFWIILVETFYNIRVASVACVVRNFQDGYFVWPLSANLVQY